jgi:hypothetical protein
VNEYGVALDGMLSLLEVYLRAPPSSNADVLMTTVHGAKGLEQHTVQLLDDFCPLAALRVSCPLVLGSGRSARTFLHEDILRLREDVYVPWVAAGGNLVLSKLEVVRE